MVRDFVGHGIGKALHEDPQVPNFGERGGGPGFHERDSPGHRTDGECRGAARRDPVDGGRP